MRFQRHGTPVLTLTTTAGPPHNLSIRALRTSLGSHALHASVCAAAASLILARVMPAAVTLKLGTQVIALLLSLVLSNTSSL